jgi:hypothetical protein
VVLANEFRPGALVAGDYPYRDNLVAGAIENIETALEKISIVYGTVDTSHAGAFMAIRQSMRTF